MAQETGIGETVITQAKERAKIEKELGVQVWVKVFITAKDEEGKEVVLKTYDLPRESLARWQWVINWRIAKLTCENPRRSLYKVLSHYDKRSGESYGFRSDLQQLIALKGKITRQENIIREYLARQKGNLFFNEGTDEQLAKIRVKLQRAKENVAAAERRLEEKVRKYQNSNK